MPSKTVKFEISVEKINVKFEGDIDFAERVHGDITNALNTLTSTQQRMLAPPKAQAAIVVPTPASARRRSRRRRSAPGDGIDPALVADVLSENTDADVIDVRPSPRSRRSTSGANALIVELKAENFFAARQTNGQIRDALAKKGHSFKSNEINPALVSLTQQGLLKREKNDKQWVYYAE